MSNPKDVLREGLLETLRQCQHLTVHEIEGLSDDLRFLETANNELKDEYLAASERFMNTVAKERESTENCKLTCAVQCWIKSLTIPKAKSLRSALEPAVSQLEQQIHEMELLTRELDDYTARIEEWTKRRK